MWYMADFEKILFESALCFISKTQTLDIENCVDN